jgi:hypothetical protein
MVDCLVNDIPERFDFLPETWGALLAGLDRRISAGRRVVTAVRFDGVDQPSFRHPDLAGVALERIARIDRSRPRMPGRCSGPRWTRRPTACPTSWPCGQMTAALRDGAPDADPTRHARRRPAVADVADGRRRHRG